MKERRSFSYQFNLAAAKKVVEQGMAVTEVAKDLGIAPNLLHRWKRQLLEEGALGEAPAGSRSIAALLPRLGIEGGFSKVMC